MTIQFTYPNREGFEDEIKRKLTDEEWAEVIRAVEKFVDNASGEDDFSQDDIDDFVVQLADEYEEEVE